MHYAIYDPSDSNFGSPIYADKFISVIEICPFQGRESVSDSISGNESSNVSVHYVDDLLPHALLFPCRYTGYMVYSVSYLYISFVLCSTVNVGLAQARSNL